MALATRCPHCQTTFRVAHDQLKLRAGIVRCGACKQIFNGIENLLPPEEVAPSTSSTSPLQVTPAIAQLETETPAPSVPDLAPPPAPDVPDLSTGTITINSLDFDIPIEPEAAEKSASNIFSAPLSPEVAPVFAPATFTKAEYRLDEPPEFSPSPAEVAPSTASQSEMESADIPDFSEATIQSLPALSRAQDDAPDTDRTELATIEKAAEADSASADEPGFIKKWQRQQRTGKIRRLFLGVGSIVLFAALMAQGAYVFRKHVVAWFPATEQVIAQWCNKLGCQLNLPAQITAVSIESSELQTLAAGKNAFALSLLLGNHSQLTQAWPSIELTLNDSNEQPVARRIFTPSEYLTSSQGKGIPADTEQPVKLFFELTQLKASGYRVYLFYS